MFYPREMTGVWLIIPAKDVLAVTRMLADRGLFHQVDASYQSSEKELGPANSWPEKAAAYAALERRVLSIMQTLGMEEGSPPLAEWASMIEVDVARPIVEQMEQEVKQTTDQLTGEHKRLEQLQSALAQLEPVAGIDLDISTLRDPRYLYSLLGVIPIANIDRLQTSLERNPFVFLTLREDDQKAVVWLAGIKRDADILERAARSAYVTPGACRRLIRALHPRSLNRSRRMSARCSSTSLN